MSFHCGIFCRLFNTIILARAEFSADIRLGFLYRLAGFISEESSLQFVIKAVVLDKFTPYY